MFTAIKVMNLLQIKTVGHMDFILKMTSPGKCNACGSSGLTGP